MKMLISQILVIALVVASIAPMVHADDNYGDSADGGTAQTIDSDSRQSKEVRGEFYLQNCHDILTVRPEDYEKTFIENAKTEGQMLQVLYDGGLIFSKLYVNAFFLTLGQTFLNSSNALDLINLTDEQGETNISLPRKEYRKLSKNLELLGRASPEELDRFIHTLLANEVALSTLTAANGKADVDEPEVRYNQIRRLVSALESTPNRDLAERSLRDVITQTVLSFAREILLARAEIEYPDPNGAVAMSTFLVGFAGAVRIGYLTAQILNYNFPSFTDNYTLLAFLSIVGSALAGGAATGFGFYSAVTLPARIRWYRLQKSTRAIEPVVYVLPKGSSEERLEIADVLKMNFDKVENASQGLSLAKACEGKTCNLTPMQIASVGDLDLLELERLLSTMRGKFAKVSNPINESELQTILNAVIQNPGDYRAQMNLRRKLDDYSTVATFTVDERQQILDQVLNKIKMLKENFDLVRERPFTELRTNDEELARGQLLLSKINNDLVRLDTVSLDAEKFQRSIDQLHATKSLIDGWVGSLPKSEHGWREAAQAILQQFNSAELKAKL